jgi:hypothetical protein
MEYICLWFVLMVFVCWAHHLDVKDSTYNTEILTHASKEAVEKPTHIHLIYMNSESVKGIKFGFSPFCKCSTVSFG